MVFTPALARAKNTSSALVAIPTLWSALMGSSLTGTQVSVIGLLILLVLWTGECKQISEIM